MVDDDVSTLLKLDPAGFHAGGTVQAGSRPLFVASGGFTVNPPDLAALRDGVRTAIGTVNPADAVTLARTAAPQVRAAVPRVVDRLRPVAARAARMMPWPDLGVAAAGLVLRGRRALGLVPRQPSTAMLVVRWLPATGLVLGAVGAVAAIVWLWHPVHGADRRRRIVQGVRARTGREPRTTPTQPGRTLVAVPVERGDGSVPDGTSLANAANA